MARSLAETLDPQEALERALAAIGEGLGWRLGAAWEPPPGEPDLLVCVETWCAPGVDDAEFVAVSRDLRLAPGEGLPGRVWATGEAAWIADVQDDANFPRAPAARRAGLHAAFCFPLRSARGVLGVVEFYTGEARELDSELLEMMATLGDQIGQAVERRRDAEHLRAARTRHEAMLEVALDAVISIDETGHVLEFNPAAERIFGYPASEAVGQDMAELIVPPELRERHRAGFARYLETREPAVLDQRLELTGMRADGSTFPVELTITRIELPDQGGFAGYVRDITDRKEAEAEMRASRARIVEAADDARQKLERDLHDGAQQRLVELGLQLRMARAKVDANPTEAARVPGRRGGGSDRGDRRAARAGARHPSRGAHRGRPAAGAPCAGRPQQHPARSSRTLRRGAFRRRSRRRCTSSWPRRSPMPSATRTRARSR